MTEPTDAEIIALADETRTAEGGANGYVHTRTMGPSKYEWVLSQWCLAIWNPNLMDFIPNKHRRDSRKLFYRAMGIVTHDRALNGRPAWH